MSTTHDILIDHPVPLVELLALIDSLDDTSARIADREVRHGEDAMVEVIHRGFVATLRRVDLADDRGHPFSRYSHAVLVHSDRDVATSLFRAIVDATDWPVALYLYDLDHLAEQRIPVSSSG